MPWVAGHGEGRARWRPIARAGGDVRGPNSGWKLPRQGCRESVCGCAGQNRSEDLVLGAASWEQTRGKKDALCLRARAPFAAS